MSSAPAAIVNLFQYPLFRIELLSWLALRKRALGANEFQYPLFRIELLSKPQIDHTNARIYVSISALSDRIAQRRVAAHRAAQ